ncbi:MAG: flagellar export chaperone FliS [Phycisphaerales bacterium]|nr:flagellar export chaperone FliS [Phycisphaerales bacterium]
MNDTNTANAYLKTKVMTASPEELRMMLLDGAVRFAHMAKVGMETKDYEKIYEGFKSSREIVLELINTINPDPDPKLAETVRGLYVFIFGELAKASLNKDMERLDKAIELLEYEQETWSKLLVQLAEDRQAGIEHSQAAAPDRSGDQPTGLSSLSIQA